MTEQKPHYANTEAAAQTYRVSYGEAVLLETDQVVVLREHYDGRDMDPVFYFAEAVIASLETTDSDLVTHCPIKGDASYLNYGEAKNALWCYRTPLPGVAQIKNHHAFDQSQGFRICPVD